MNCKGIVMAGGKGTRLKPLTDIINKHLLYIYNKPMIYYSLSTLIYSGIKDIQIICNPGDEFFFKKILNKVEKKNNLKLSFKNQNKIGGGIAEGLILSKDFIGNSKKIVFILGDNFFYGKEFPMTLKKIVKKKTNKSFIFLSEVNNPKDYGVAYLKNNRIKSIIEKPKNQRSNLAITGLYVYNTEILNLQKKLKRSNRNELEISSLNKLILKEKKLDYIKIGKGTSWFDMGTYENIFQCAELIRLIENRQGIKISNLIS